MPFSLNLKWKVLKLKPLLYEKKNAKIIQFKMWLHFLRFITPTRIVPAQTGNPHLNGFVLSEKHQAIGPGSKSL